jgi:hypothetical protein
MEFLPLAFLRAGQALASWMGPEMVGDFGVGDGAAGFGVVGVVVRVVGGEDRGGGSHDGADLLGGGHFNGCGEVYGYMVESGERKG